MFNEFILYFNTLRFILYNELNKCKLRSGMIENKVPDTVQAKLGEFPVLLVLT